MVEKSNKSGARLSDDLLLKDVPREQYYFAYGSDLNSQQISARCAKPKVVGLARLADHKVGFYGYTVVWDGAEATVIPAPGHDVWGVVYDLSVDDQEQLDDAQDARLDGSGSYFHTAAKVTGQDGTIYPVVLFKKDKLSKPTKPTEEYLDFILEGAVDRGLPAAYVETLRAFESTKAKYDVPRAVGAARGMHASDCGSCGDAAPEPSSKVINITLGSGSQS